jgi:hypothetical protein
LLASGISAGSPGTGKRGPADGAARHPYHGATPETATEKLKDPNTKDEAFEEVVKSAQAAAVLVLVY